MRLFLIHLPDQVDDETFTKLAHILDEDAQVRIRKFRLPQDSLRSLVGRLAPIWFLHHASLLHTPSETTATPRFGKKAKGKPTLVEPALNPPLSFNTSHDGRYVLLGITRGEEPEIGVDLMQLPEDAWDIQEAISEQLVPEERAVLALPLTPLARSKLITTLWTLKEGFVKATGDGVGFGLQRIHVDIDPHGQVHGFYVDGRDLHLDGWRFDSGFINLDEGPSTLSKGYGWAAYWKGQPVNEKKHWEGVLERIEWEDFVSRLLDPKPSKES